MNTSEPKRQTQETTIHQQLVQLLRALQVPKVPNPNVKQSQVPNLPVQQSIEQQSPVQQSQVPKPADQSLEQQYPVQQPPVQQPPVQHSPVHQSQVPKPALQSPEQQPPRQQSQQQNTYLRKLIIERHAPHCRQYMTINNKRYQIKSVMI